MRTKAQSQAKVWKKTDGPWQWEREEMDSGTPLSFTPVAVEPIIL